MALNFDPKRPILLCLCKKRFYQCSQMFWNTILVVTIKVFHLKYVYEPGNCNQFVKPFLEIRTCSKWHVTHVNVSFKSRNKFGRSSQSLLSNNFFFISFHTTKLWHKRPVSTEIRDLFVRIFPVKNKL